MATELAASQRRRGKRRSEAPVAVDDDIIVMAPGTTATPSQAQPLTQAAGATQALPADVYQYDPAEVTQMKQKMKQYEEAAAKALEDSQSISLEQEHIPALVARVVRHMLFKNYEKFQVPVPRKELTDLIQEDVKGHRDIKKIPGLVITLAQARTLSSFGLEMKELERVTEGKKEAGTKSYVLRSVLPAGLRSALVHSSAREVHVGFMMVVLALIIMNGDKMESGELWRHLGQLGCRQDDPHHPLFGDVKAELHKMEQQRYLVSKRSDVRNPETNQPEVEHRWGEAAQADFSRAQVQAAVERWLKEAERGGAAAREQEDDVMELSQ